MLEVWAENSSILELAAKMLRHFIEHPPIVNINKRAKEGRWCGIGILNQGKVLSERHFCNDRLVFF